MNIHFSSAILMLCCIALLSCSSPTKQGADEDPLAQVVDAYLSVKDALVKTDGAATQSAAKELMTALADQKGELIDQIKSETEHISGTMDTEAQRIHFETLSDHLYQYLKSSQAYAGAKLYRQYCPMAMENQGAHWLSNSKEVLNPYFGDKMLKCGSVKEEL